MSPCECCGQRLPGEPSLSKARAQQAKIDNEDKRRRRYHTDFALAMGLRAEGASEKEIARIRGLSVGMGLWGRRRLRGVSADAYAYAPGMVQRWGRNVSITRAG